MGNANVMGSPEAINTCDTYRYNIAKEDTYRNSIKMELEKRFSGRRCNILFMGAPGTGKSTLVNSLMFAYTAEEHWQERSKCGGFSDNIGRETLNMLPFYFKDFKQIDETQFDSVLTLIDCGGWLKTLKEKEEFFELLLDGKIPWDTHMKEILHEKNLSDMFNEPDPKRVIDRVVIVAAADEPLEDQLTYQMIVDICLTRNKERRCVPVFGAMTKCDRLQDKAFFETRKEELLGLLGSKNNNYNLLQCCLYVLSVVKPPIKHTGWIDKPLLDFLLWVISTQNVPYRQVDVSRPSSRPNPMGKIASTPVQASLI